MTMRNDKTAVTHGTTPTTSVVEVALCDNCGGIYRDSARECCLMPLRSERKHRALTLHEAAHLVRSLAA